MEAVAFDCSANGIHRAYCRFGKPLCCFGSGVFMDFGYHESKKYDTIKEKKNERIKKCGYCGIKLPFYDPDAMSFAHGVQ